MCWIYEILSKIKEKMLVMIKTVAKKINILVCAIMARPDCHCPKFEMGGTSQGEWCRK